MICRTSFKSCHSGFGVSGIALPGPRSKQVAIIVACWRRATAPITSVPDFIGASPPTGGLYTRGTVRMFSEMAAGFGF